MPGMDPAAAESVRAYLLELQERGVQRAVVDAQLMVARLFNPPGDAVSVQRSERLQRLEDHQGQRALPDVGAVSHMRYA